MNITMRFPEWRAKVFTMSYDDGVVQDIRLIEIMSKYGLKGTFNINCGMMGNADMLGQNGRMNFSQMQKLYLSSGNEVAVHGYTHPYLNTLEQTAVIEEVSNDRRILEKMTGGIVRGMAYPFGTYNNDVINALRILGIVYARTTKVSENFDLPTDWLRLQSTCHHAHPELFNFAERFLSMKPAEGMITAPCLMFYVWGHSFEFDHVEGAWERMEKFASAIGGREDVWYATNIEIYDYIDDFKRLRFSYDGRTIYNPTSRVLYMIGDGERIMVKPGEQTIVGVKN